MLFALAATLQLINFTALLYILPVLVQVRHAYGFLPVAVSRKAYLCSLPVLGTRMACYMPRWMRRRQ